MGKVHLIITPNWSPSHPPLGMAMIAKSLKLAGHTVGVSDFNVEICQYLEQNKGLKLYMDFYENESVFLNESMAEKFIIPQLDGLAEKLIDEVVESKPDVVGFSIFYSCVGLTRYFARELKRKLPSVSIIFGGPHINFERICMENEFKSGIVDAVVFGEGENTSVELVDRLLKGESLEGCHGIAWHLGEGKFKMEPTRDPIDMDDLPFPDFDMFPLDKYLMDFLPISMSRGCILKCTFCEETRNWHKFRYRSPDKVVAELKRNVEEYGINKFFFCESLINGNFDILAKVSQGIIDENLKISMEAYARLDRRMTTEFIELMAKAGWSRLLFGFETGSQKVNNLMRKGTQISESRRIIRDCMRFGIKPHLQIIVGFPGESDEDFRETYDFVDNEAESIHGISVTEMIIIANTPVYQRASEYGVDKESAENGPHWKTVDGLNTHEIRVQRRNELDDLARKRGLVSYLR